jgi:hypothetical protein
LLESLFGQNLADHLWGYNCETQSYRNSNAFNGIGLITLAISLVIVIIYYYVINHPRFNRWWSWLIMLGVSGISCLFIGYQWTATDFINGYIGDCLMYIRDEDGNIVSSLIHEADCWMFGVANLIISVVFFIAFTFVVKIAGRFIPLSRNCKYSPF